MKLIKMSDTHYIIVDDSQINIGDIVAEKLLTGRYELFEIHTLNDIDKQTQKKVTHSTQLDKGMGNVTFISLSEVEELVNGYSVEKMANLHAVKSGCQYREDLVRISKAYQKGFNNHKELVKDKLFTIKDMENMFILGGKYKIQNPDKFLEKMKEIIQSILPKNEWEVEFDEQGKLRLL